MMQEAHSPLWILDIEASGLSSHSYPIEIAASNGVQNFSSLIKPAMDWLHWDQDAQQLHQIERRALLDQGQSIDAVCWQLNKLLGSQTVFCDCEDWDGFWLHRLFSKSKLRPSFKLDDIEHLLHTDQQILEYQQNKQSLQTSGQFIAHRALNDAQLIQQSLAALAHSDCVKNRLTPHK
jgi:hypothetical protein